MVGFVRFGLTDSLFQSSKVILLCCLFSFLIFFGIDLTRSPFSCEGSIVIFRSQNNLEKALWWDRGSFPFKLNYDLSFV